MNSTNVIITVLNYVLDKFKVKHAGIYAIVMAVLGAILVLCTYFQGNIGIHLSPVITNIIQIVSVVLMGLVGTHTPQKNVQDSETKN